MDGNNKLSVHFVLAYRCREHHSVLYAQNVTTFIEYDYEILDFIEKAAKELHIPEFEIVLDMFRRDQEASELFEEFRHSAQKQQTRDCAACTDRWVDVMIQPRYFPKIKSLKKRFLSKQEDTSTSQYN